MIGKFFFVLLFLLCGNTHGRNVFRGNTAAMDAGECIQSSCLGLLVAICVKNITFVSFDLRHNQLYLKIVAASIINLMF